MPFGIQLVGKRYADHQLLSIARALEQSCREDVRLRRPLPDTAFQPRS